MYLPVNETFIKIDDRTASQFLFVLEKKCNYMYIDSVGNLKKLNFGMLLYFPFTCYGNGISDKLLTSA